MPGGFFVAMRVLGLMSGTSADGVDAVLAEFSGPPRRPHWHLLSRAAAPYPPELRNRLIAAGQGQPIPASDVLELGEELTEMQAEAARACDPRGTAELVGCHGQTLWHRPPQADRRGSSWQLLQGPLLAQLLQRPVVFDFRAADLALGGQGAPLVPAADAALLPAQPGRLAFTTDSYVVRPLEFPGGDIGRSGRITGRGAARCHPARLDRHRRLDRRRRLQRRGRRYGRCSRLCGRCSRSRLSEGGILVGSA